MRIRMVAGPSMKELAEHITDAPLPNPLLSVGWIAEEDDGTFIGRIVLHSVPVIGYLKVEPGHNGLASDLIERATQFVINSNAQCVLMQTEHPAIEKIAKRHGCREMPLTYLEWERK